MRGLVERAQPLRERWIEPVAALERQALQPARDGQIDQRPQGIERAAARRQLAESRQGRRARERDVAARRADPADVEPFDRALDRTGAQLGERVRGPAAHRHERAQRAHHGVQEQQRWPLEVLDGRPQRMAGDALDVVRAAVLGHDARRQEALLDPEVLPHDQMQRAEPVHRVLREELGLAVASSVGRGAREPLVLEDDELAARVTELEQAIRVDPAQVVVGRIRQHGGEQVVRRPLAHCGSMVDVRYTRRA